MEMKLEINRESSSKDKLEIEVRNCWNFNAEFISGDYKLIR